MDKKWVFKTFDKEQSSALQEALEIHPVLCDLLIQRGIENYDEAKQFFRPSLKDLHDPFLMMDMEKAVERIDEAMYRNEKILIYGDYDVDGTTAIALTYSFFSQFYPNLDFYVPDRYKEGYGISIQGVDYAAENDFTLIIALDCGIKAVDQVAYAKSKGIDFIICDHHRPGADIPKACAVLDPKRADCTYPFDELSGCGIGFKLIQAFAMRKGLDFSMVKNQLDLVVVSIAADIVPIIGENRILAFYGLKKLNSNPQPGLKSLILVSGVDKQLGISDIVFTIGPRINAAGRMDSARGAVKLLVTEENLDANHKAAKLNNTNTRRREIDREITEEALAMIASDNRFSNRKSTVLHQPHWHKGVIGIVASRLIEHYYRPTIILTSSNGEAAGSARSVAGFDVYNAIKECEELLTGFGGHKYAAGLTLVTENIPAFTEKFEAVVSAQLKEGELIPELLIDARLDLRDINFKFHRILEQFAPFGPGNMKPVFYTEKAKDTGGSILVGQQNKHLKLEVLQENSPIFDGIAFNQFEAINIVKTRTFDVCFNLEVNEWRGNRKLQLMVKDIR